MSRTVFISALPQISPGPKKKKKDMEPGWLPEGREREEEGRKRNWPLQGKSPALPALVWTLRLDGAHSAEQDWQSQPLLGVTR